MTPPRRSIRHRTSRRGWMRSRRLPTHCLAPRSRTSCAGCRPRMRSSASSTAIPSSTTSSGTRTASRPSSTSTTSRVRGSRRTSASRYATSRTRRSLRTSSPATEMRDLSRTRSWRGFRYSDEPTRWSHWPASSPFSPRSSAKTGRTGRSRSTLACTRSRLGCEPSSPSACGRRTVARHTSPAGSGSSPRRCAPRRRRTRA